MAHDIPSTMKGLQVEKFKQPYTYKTDIPVPKCGPKDVLVQVRTAGYCHTEAMVVNGEFSHMMRGGLPLIPSHEPTGVVVAVGEEAALKSGDEPGAAGQGPFKVGDRVAAIAFKDFCGKCEDCKAGNYKFCDDQDMCGVTSDGAFAEYVACDYRSTVRLPDGLSFDTAAPLACAGTTIITAIKAAQLKPGQRLCMIGGGALGHLGVQISKTMGFETVLVDARDPPLELCKKLRYAPDFTFNNSKTNVNDKSSVAQAVQACGGLSDAVIVTTDAIPAFTLGLELTKKHGLLIVVGQPEPPIPIPFHHLIFRDLTVKGSLLGNTADFRELCELVVSKGIEVKTKAYDLQSVPQLIHDYHQDSHAGKLVVRVTTDETSDPKSA